MVYVRDNGVPEYVSAEISTFWVVSHLSALQYVDIPKIKIDNTASLHKNFFIRFHIGNMNAKLV